MARAAEAGVEAAVIGTTGGDALTIRLDGQPVLVAPVGDLHAVWAHALEHALAAPR